MGIALLTKILWFSKGEKPVLKNKSSKYLHTCTLGF